MTKKALFLSVVLAFALTSCAGKELAKKYQLMDETELTKVVEKFKEISTTLGSQMEAAAASVGANPGDNQAVNAALADLCIKNTGFAIDCAYIDSDGMIQNMEPSRYKKYIGMSVKNQAPTVAMDTAREPLFGRVLPIERVKGAVFQWPVFTKDGQFAGAVSMLFNPDKFIDINFRPIVRGSEHEYWIIQKDGTFLYSSDADVIGRNLFNDAFEMRLMSLVSLGKEIAAEPEGKGKYTVPGAGQSGDVYKECIWKTLVIHNANLRFVQVEER